MSKACIPLLVFLALGAFAAAAAPPTRAPASQPAATILVPQPDDLAPILAPIQTKYQVPGMIAAILDGERVTAIGATGVRKIGAATPLRTSDLIHIGSCTKAMTATLIGRLVDDKKLAWDTPLSQAIPRLAPAMHADTAKITVAQLLHHTAGLPNNVSWWDYDRTHRLLPEQRLSLVKDVLGKPPTTALGQTYAYSNVGYVVLGAILEERLGRPWETLIHDGLFAPLGMRSAGFGAPGTPGQTDQPWGHTGEPPRLTPVQSDNAPCLGPAGRVHCTVEDWARFVALHMQALQGQPRILSAESFAALHTPAKGQEYAGGWIAVEREWAGGTAFTHAGSNTTWYCVVWMAPKRNFAVLVATNTGQKDAAKACDDASAALIGHHLKLKPTDK